MNKNILFLVLLTICSSQYLPYNQLQASNIYFTSIAAYCPDSTFSAWNCSFCESKGLKLTQASTIYTKNRQTLFIVAKESSKLNAVVIIVRGNSDAQFKNTTSFMWQTMKSYNRCDKCEVNKYLAGQLQSVEQQLITFVRARIDKKHTTVSVFGYSIGGGIVNLVVPALFVNGLPLGHVFSFGAPRVGNFRFATYVRNIMEATSLVRRMRRVTNGADIVPQQNRMIRKYQHVIREYFYEKGGRSVIQCSDFDVEDPHCTLHYDRPQLNYQDHLTYFKSNFLALIKQCRQKQVTVTPFNLNTHT